MAKLEWDKTGQKFYETGVDRGVFYPYSSSAEAEHPYMPGEVWNGLSAVNQSPSGAEATPIYADNTKYLNLISAETFGATIEAYTYPKGFASCNGEAEVAKGVTIGQQKRNMFGFSYRTILGNDTEGESYGYKLHLIYGCQASPSEKAYNTTNESPEAASMSWEVTTTPVNVEGFKPTASLEITSTEVPAAALKAIEDALYGTASAEAYLPLPADIIKMVTENGGDAQAIAG